MALIGVKRLRALLPFAGACCELSRWSRRIGRRRSQLDAFVGTPARKRRLFPQRCSSSPCQLIRAESNHASCDVHLKADKPRLDRSGNHCGLIGPQPRARPALPLMQRASYVIQNNTGCGVAGMSAIRSGFCSVIETGSDSDPLRKFL